MLKLLNIYRYLRNYITIEIEGGFPERFFNLCNREKIHLWDTGFSNRNITAKIYCRDFYKIRKIRAKSGVRIKITGKYGFSFFFIRHKNRKMLFAGMVASLIFFILMNQFIWSIEIKGKTDLSRVEIIQLCNNSGLDYGTFVPLFDEAEASREAVNTMQGKILWMAINIKGSKAVIEIRDYSDKTEVTNDNTPCNIIADFDGVIISCEAFSGEGTAITGSAVKKGDLLISGISENSDGTVNFHCADGRVTAMHKADFEMNFEKSEAAIQTNEISRCKEIDIFSVGIPLSYNLFINNGDKVSYKKQLTFDNKMLPFIITESVLTKKTGINFNQNDLIFQIDNFTKAEYEKFKNTLILDCQYTLLTNDNTINISADYNCIDFIGKKNAILQEN